MLPTRLLWHSVRQTPRLKPLWPVEYTQERKVKGQPDKREMKFWTQIEWLPHLLSQTKDRNVIKDVAVIAKVLNDLLYASPSLFRLHRSCCNVVVPDLSKKWTIPASTLFWDNYRDSNVSDSLSMGAVGRCDNVPTVHESSPTYRIRVYLPSISAQKTHLIKVSNFVLRVLNIVSKLTCQGHSLHPASLPPTILTRSKQAPTSRLTPHRTWSLIINPLIL